MKISRAWLQTFFETPLPEAAALADALTFHTFEIESVEKHDDDDVLDVKITANRGHDCHSHRGIAKEISAILDSPMKGDALRQAVSLEPKTDAVQVSLEVPLCNRFTAAYLRGVKVGPSPEWLRQRLERIGQKSINNVVDATNYVMFDIGQPLHAFDAGKLTQKENRYAIVVRNAREKETMLALDDKAYTLASSMMVVSDAHADTAIGIAGVKGGKPSGIDHSTQNIILEAANFDGVSVRKTAQALKLRTDAAARFEQVISPEMAAYGMRAAAELIVQLAGGEVVGFVDAYPNKPEQETVSVSTSKINTVLGTALSDADVERTFKRLGFSFVKNEEVFTVTPPFERLDLVPPAGGPEDLVEEVGRIIGYDQVPATQLPPFPGKIEINKRFAVAEARREALLSKGYSEVFTSVFADKGERVIANKVDGVRPYLRATLIDGLRDAYEKNVRNKDLLGLKEIRIFEIGTVWKEGGEWTMIGTADPEGAREELLDGETGEFSPHYKQFPISTATRYQSFSKYPFIVRDVALWVPASTKPEDVLDVIRAHAGELLVRSEKFDEFKKGERTSYAFRLVFQSFERTLTEVEANAVMEKIAEALKAKGFEVR